MTRLSALTAICCVALVMTIGCRRASLNSACPHDERLRTYAQWHSQIVFPYIAAEDKLRHIKNNYDRVTDGSSKSEVIQAFGPPDFEEELYPKVQNQSCMYEFEYFFEKPADTVNEFKDKRITVFFSQSGKVRWMVGNVGLPDKGEPGRRQPN